LANYKVLECYPFAIGTGDGDLFLFARVVAAVFLTVASSAGAARASSFVVMGETEPAATPSIVTLGSPAATRSAEARPSTPSWVDKSHQALQEAFRQADWRSFPSIERQHPGTMETPSIVAMGEPFAEVTGEKVAAIPQKRGQGPNFEPLVIRGGIVGDAFPPARVADNAETSKKAGEPAQQASASDGDSPAPAPAPNAPPAYLPPNGLGKHRY